LANFSIGHARRRRFFVPQNDRKIGYVMGRYEGSIGELFYRSCTADRSFVLQDDRKIGYVMGRNEASMANFSIGHAKANRSFVPIHVTRSVYTKISFKRWSRLTPATLRWPTLSPAEAAKRVETHFLFFLSPLSAKRREG